MDDLLQKLARYKESSTQAEKTKEAAEFQRLQAIRNALGPVRDIVNKLRALGVKVGTGPCQMLVPPLEDTMTSYVLRWYSEGQHRGIEIWTSGDSSKPLSYALYQTAGETHSSQRLCCQTENVKELIEQFLKVLAPYHT